MNEQNVMLKCLKLSSVTNKILLYTQRLQILPKGFWLHTRFHCVLFQNRLFIDNAVKNEITWKEVKFWKLITKTYQFYVTFKTDNTVYVLKEIAGKVPLLSYPITGNNAGQRGYMHKTLNKKQVFWDIIPHLLVNSYRPFLAYTSPCFTPYFLSRKKVSVNKKWCSY